MAPVYGKTITGSLAANTTFPLIVQGRQLSIVAQWTGGTGTFSLEAQKPDGTYAPVPGASAEFTANGNAQPAGSASAAVWTWSNVPATALQLKWTGSGAGTFTAKVTYPS